MRTVTTAFVAKERLKREPFQRAIDCGDVRSSSFHARRSKIRTVAKALCVVFAVANMYACPKPHTAASMSQYPALQQSHIRNNLVSYSFGRTEWQRRGSSDTITFNAVDAEAIPSTAQIQCLECSQTCQT